MGWVVLAIVGVVADFAVVGSVIRPIRPALRAFQETGDIAALESSWPGSRSGSDSSILGVPSWSTSAQRVGPIWAGVVPAGATRASIGLDLLAEQIGKAVYSIQLNLRRGIDTFTKWRLTKEAADLIGDINQLSPAQIAQVRALYSQAIENTQRIASQGRQLGLTLDEVDAVVQQLGASRHRDHR